MPGVLPRMSQRGLKLLADGKNGFDALVSQQQKGIGGPGPGNYAASGTVAVNEGTLFKQTGSGGGWTSGTGMEVVKDGTPVVRHGLITWHNPHAGTTVTKAMQCAHDSNGNVRFTIDEEGVRTWKANGELEAWIYQYA